MKFWRRLGGGDFGRVGWLVSGEEGGVRGGCGCGCLAVGLGRRERRRERAHREAGREKDGGGGGCMVVWISTLLSLTCSSH